MGAYFVPNLPEFFSSLCCNSYEVYLSSAVVTRNILLEVFCCSGEGFALGSLVLMRTVYMCLLEFPISEDKETILLSESLPTRSTLWYKRLEHSTWPDELLQGPEENPS